MKRFYATTWRYPNGDKCYCVRDRTRSGAFAIYWRPVLAREAAQRLNLEHGEFREWQ